MKSSSLFIAIIMVAAMFAAAPSMVIAQENDKVQPPKVVEIIGVVSVAQDEEGVITGISLLSGADEDATVVRVTIDAKGKALAMAAANGEIVKVTGVSAIVEGVETVTVKKFELVKEEKEDVENDN